VFVDTLYPVSKCHTKHFSFLNLCILILLFILEDSGANNWGEVKISQVESALVIVYRALLHAL